MSSQHQTFKDYPHQMRHPSRSKFLRINSLDLIPEDPSQEEDSESSSSTTTTTRTITTVKSTKNTSSLGNGASVQQKKDSYIRRNNSKRTLSRQLQQLIFFWPNLLLMALISIGRTILYVPLSIAAPSFWLSALLWIFWKLVNGPIMLIKWLINSDSLGLNTINASNGSSGRTVLVSSGSTIQTLHLARNFYSSGARVVVFEFDGLFGLSRFSTAVDKFYVVPRPTASNQESYIAALCHIVKKEKPQVYIPVCATSPAYYDALVKPHLELLGCATFAPSLQETRLLDDCLAFYQKCGAQNIPLPPHTLLSSPDELIQLYESGFISNSRNILMAVGMQGILKRYKYILPSRRQDLRFNHEISERQQWLVVRDQQLGYHHYLTCTTVRDSRVVANVTCRVDYHTKNLIPLWRNARSKGDIRKHEDEAQIEFWLHTFFAKVRFQRSINGHISFRFIKDQSGQLLPLGVRLGVSLPYVCYNQSHARILSSTVRCVHRRHNENEDKCQPSVVSSFSSNFNLRSNAQMPDMLDKCEALFAYWDPLPYCAYYHFQIPLETVKLFLQKRNGTKSLSPVAVSVH